MTSHRAEQRLWPVRWQLNRLDRRRSLSHYWTSPSHQFWRAKGEKQPSHSYKQPGQTVKAAGLARTMSGALKFEEPVNPSSTVQRPKRSVVEPSRVRSARNTFRGKGIGLHFAVNGEGCG